MRFMMMVKHPEKFSGPPPKELMDAIGNLLGEDAKNGRTMVASGGLAPAAQSTHVRISRGKLSTIDGPYAEAKEVVGGFAIFDLKSKEEAVESAERFMELHLKHWPGRRICLPGNRGRGHNKGMVAAASGAIADLPSSRWIPGRRLY